MSEKQTYRDSDDMPTERAVLEREWKAMRLALSMPRALAAPTAQAPTEPVAVLHDDGYWTPEDTPAGRALNTRLMRAGSREKVFATPTSAAAQPEAVGWLTDDQIMKFLAPWHINGDEQDRQDLIAAVRALMPVAGLKRLAHWVALAGWKLGPENHEYRERMFEAMNAMLAAAPTTEATSSPSDAERLDAARYRWLRRADAPFDVWTDDPDGFIAHSETLDAAIDAAIRATKGGEL